ncbi:hypothetical protein ACJJTC_015150 [Scirpophaga incertulas]
MWTAASKQESEHLILTNIANVSYAVDKDGLSALASIFSPRMDFDQWKPLTGRGDPLRNDPTFDYEPPVLERVHYWADDARLEREHYPDRKSEVLMLGVSSRKPSVAPRPVPLRRHPRPQLSKYEDFSYKVSEQYPMTILVPPPPPPPRQQLSHYLLSDGKITLPHDHKKPTKVTPLTTFGIKSTTPAADHISTQYTLQEANLIYQSSMTSQNWFENLNHTKSNANSVSSDYAGWGPTTPLHDIDKQNDTHNSHNLIPNDNILLYKHPYKFYKPMLSEAPPPPPQSTSSSVFLPTFVPTTLPATEATPIQNITQTVTQNYDTSTETATIPSNAEYYDEFTTNNLHLNKFETTESQITNNKQEQIMIDMLRPMMTMPMINGPERLEDNLYAHASEILHVYNNHELNDIKTLETMQPPPPLSKTDETTTESQHNHYAQNHIMKNFNNRKPVKFAHDSYFHIFPTTLASIPDSIRKDNAYKFTSELPAQDKFLIIQGHSKVKTYSSKPNVLDDSDTINNEIQNVNETTEVRHLHPIKGKKSENNNYIRESRSKNLKSLIADNIGSIEIQEANVGIKYDVSDGSDVPFEIYRRGIVDNDDNDYSSKKKHENRTKRNIDLDELLPFDEDDIGEFVNKLFHDRHNSTGGFAQAISSEDGSIIDKIINEDDDDKLNEQKR